MMKKLRNVLFVMVLLIALSLTTASVFAAEQTDKEVKADALKIVNLFTGTSNGDQLYRQPTRIESLIMTIRLLGEEAQAKAGNYTHPFTDVPQWADKYVGYAYEKGLSVGLEDGTFGSTQGCTLQQYLTLMLRAAGVKDDGKVYDNAFALAEEKGLLKGSIDRNHFGRGEMVQVSYNALDMPVVIETEEKVPAGDTPKDEKAEKATNDGSAENTATENTINTANTTDNAGDTANTAKTTENAENVPNTPNTTENAVNAENTKDTTTVTDTTTVPETENTKTVQTEIKLSDLLIQKGAFSKEQLDSARNRVAEGPRQVRAVYLTFDDGPSTKVTPSILNTLKEYDVQATFFLAGTMVSANPSMVKREYEEGHKLANHSYSHNYSYLYKSSANLLADIAKCNTAINNALGFEYNTKVFRFPGGSHKKSQTLKSAVTNAGYSYYDWNCAGNDAISTKPVSSSYVYSSTVKTLPKTGDVIVLYHDTNAKTSTAQALPDVIKYFMSQGFVFRTL